MEVRPAAVEGVAVEVPYGVAVPARKSEDETTK